MSLKSLLKKIFHKKDPRYISEIDKFLMDFDEQHPQKSLSQQAEIKKYKRIFNLRDNVQSEIKKNTLWEQF